MKISDVSISRPVLATMGSLALVLFGVLGYLRLPVRELPDIDPPIVSVETSLRGANPRVMESSVTDVLEEELSTAEGIRTLTSSSNEQRSSVRLEFGLSRDVESAAQDVRDLVSRVRGRLPEDVDEPVVAKQDADARPFYYLALTSTTLDLLQLNDVADRIVKQRLQTIPGVARAQIQGERRYAMKIWLDQNALTARSLTVQDVAAAIRARNVEVPAGRIESSQREFTVRSLGELRTPNEFADLVVSSQGGVLTKLRDVGRVELGPANDRSALRFDQHARHRPRRDPPVEGQRHRGLQGDPGRAALDPGRVAARREAGAGIRPVGLRRALDPRRPAHADRGGAAGRSSSSSSSCATCGRRSSPPSPFRPRSSRPSR